MASGKLSPRQKMINMMYLVLTALLALQVSSEILHSFETIGDSLRTSATKILFKNQDHAEDIKKLIEDEIKQGNRKNEKYIAESELITQKAKEQLAFIEALIDSMKSIGEIDPETGKIKNLNETEKNYRFWMIGKGGGETANGGRGGGNAKILRDNLNAYIDWANEWLSKHKSKLKLQYIALDPKDDPTIDKKNPRNREILAKPWEYTIFHGAPVIANVAILEMLKNDVLNVQTDLLAHLESMVGQVPFKIDSLVLKDAPAANAVLAGTNFESEVYVTVMSKDIKPQFSGPGLKNNPGGTATIKMIANASVIPPGKSEGFQSYTVSAKVPKADGTFQNMTLTKKFKVLKPSFSIKSDQGLSLYRECCTDIEVDPGCGANFDIILGLNPGKVMPKPGSKYKFTLVPSGDKALVSVSANLGGQTIKLGDQSFVVKTPPDPNIVIVSGNKRWDGVTPISFRTPFEIAVDPDKEFEKSHPKDCRYKLINIKVSKQSLAGGVEEGNDYSCF
ncbi:MAG: hypothetical protein KatS3mg035_0207 [Bacteroidia bacterium]|nr:MAG: hypothetical protein KatS3mg035_0207 [Bacteroidia bacterium]